MCIVKQEIIEVKIYCKNPSLKTSFLLIKYIVQVFYLIFLCNLSKELLNKNKKGLYSMLLFSSILSKNDNLFEN